MAAAIYPYLGTVPRHYPQYMDVTGSLKPLDAEPGESYAIIPAPGYSDAKGKPTLAVPPADGLWGDEASPAKDDDDKPAKASTARSGKGANS